VTYQDEYIMHVTYWNYWSTSYC